ncbi:MAG: Gfo/Idh/MocA family protein [Acidimicrobiia bacterium]
MAEGSKPPGVVVVGTGFGCRVHVPAARAAGFEIAAVVGRDRERTERRAAKVGVDAVCTSLADALKLPNADVVVISTPPTTHADLAEEAIAAGRHVLVEKPFTTNAAEARHVTDAAAKAGVTALVGHEFRFARERVTMRQAIRDGLVGEPRLVALVGHSSFAAPLDVSLPRWWFDPSSGGGWLGAAVSHIVDATRCWLGDFASVSAVLPMASDRDIATQAEDTVSARFTLTSGCEGVMQQSAGTWGEPVNVMRVAGPKGTVSIGADGVRFGDAEGTRPLPYTGPPPPVELEESDDPRHRFTHLELAPAIVQAGILRDLAQGRSPEYDIVPPATFADGVACMDVLDAMRESSRLGGATVSIGRP